MAKNDPRAPEPTAKPAPTAADPSAIEAKLAPLDEFRGRAESWMKEITAQVARLAGRSEEEERRKGALDKRLGDIEDRMQSLLTLTEMVSSSKNPFAGPPREARPAPSAPATAVPAAPAAPSEPSTAVAPTPPPAPPAEEAEVGEETAPMAPPIVDAPPPSAPTPPSTPRAHPNDAQAESRITGTPPQQPNLPEGRTAVRSVADTFPQRSTAASPSQANVRFFVLEWARLLAPAVERIDMSGFLGFYVEAGWVSPQVAATVRNLTLQLGRAAKGSDSGMELDELHARSILLVGRLQGAAPRPEAARQTLMDAREVATGTWATVQR